MVDRTEHVSLLHNESEQRLQTTIEELETSNQELQSTNEELIAANEELRNVNAANEQKIAELTDLMNDMDNLFMNTNIATILLDKEKKIKRFTPSATDIIHILDIDIGRPIHHITNRLKYDRFNEDIDEVLFTYQRIDRDVQATDTKWYNMKMVPYRTGDQIVEGIVITFNDITDIKEVNRELEISHHAIEKSSSSILSIDLRGVILYANNQVEAHFGFDKYDILGANILDLYGDKMKAEHFRAIWQEVLHGQKWTGEITFYNKEEIVQWAWLELIPVFNEMNQVIQVLFMADDITEKKQAEQVLRKSEMLSALGQLAAGIAHEIRNPLTSLKGFLQLMHGTNKYNEEYAKLMMSEFDRIETIINELLVLARPQFVTFELSNLAHLIHDICLLMEPQAVMDDVEITNHLPEELPLVKCIEKEIKQVFINLLKNGIEAMPSGGKITIESNIEDSGTLLLRFKDQGTGIPKEKLNKLGEPFYTTKEKGTGLGLMVSMKIIENHNGSIEFKSEYGKGTTVEVRLPIEFQSIQLQNSVEMSFRF